VDAAESIGLWMLPFAADEDGRFEEILHIDPVRRLTAKASYQRD
jgi:hypothetical protein